MTKHPMTPPALQASTDRITIPWIPATVKRWESTIDQMAKQYNIDPNLLAIIMTLESGGYPKAHSEAAAQGLMQVTPPTAHDIALKFLHKPTSSFDLYNPTTNIEFGAAYLSYLRNQFARSDQGPSWNSTVELVAAGYNGGPGAANSVADGTGLSDMQTVSYSRDAFNMWRERGAARSPTYERWLARGGQDLINKAKATQ